MSAPPEVIGARLRRAGVAVLVIVVSPACARSEVDICIDRLQNIAGTRQSGDAVEARCVEAVEKNGGKSPF